MANPQIEDGYIRIARELLKAMTRANFSGSEFMVLLAVITKTYGWNKKEDQISINQFTQLTGLTKRAICRATLSLVNKKTLGRRQNGINSVTTYWVEKDYDKWIVCSEQKDTSDNLDTRGSDNFGKKVVTILTPTINTIQKTILYTPPLQVEQVFTHFKNTCNKPRFLLTKERGAIIEKRLKEGYTLEQINQAITNFSQDDWADRHKYCDLVYAIGNLKGVNNLDKWLNYEPKPKIMAGFE